MKDELAELTIFKAQVNERLKAFDRSIDNIRSDVGKKIGSGAKNWFETPTKSSSPVKTVI